MPKKTPSAAPSKPSKRKADSAADGGTAFGRRLITAANEALAHARGEVALSVYEVEIPETVDALEIRKSLGLSQRQFSARFGVHLGALQAWEQGRRQPDRTARILLAVIAREPEAVRRALEKPI
jgi:putative transcriptional regulator